MSRLPPALNAAIARTISRYTAVPPVLETVDEVGGGSISRAFVVGNAARCWFVKVDRGDALALYAAEADGLAALRRCPALRVPEVVGYGVCGGPDGQGSEAGENGVDAGYAYLVLEHLELKPLRGNARAAGHALAALHRCGGDAFGWPRANFIGRTRQDNAADDDWPRFFARRRLAPQLEGAQRKGMHLAGGDRLLAALPAFFGGYRPLPSLIHGDLWHGNAALDAAGTLTLFDPSVHYADRECDLAMAALFGGFPDAFFGAYAEAWPLADGAEHRRALYQLYHVLNHANLFGGSYVDEAQQLIARLLALTAR